MPIYTEVLGFILLSLAALIAKVAVGSGVDARLFGVVAVFFTAGVFRVPASSSKRNWGTGVLVSLPML